MTVNETTILTKSDKTEEPQKEQAENNTKNNNLFLCKQVFALAVVLSLCCCLGFSWFRHGGTTSIAASSSDMKLRPATIELPNADASIKRPLPGCFTSTKDIFEAMLRADPAQEHVYKICPNTVINVGRMDDSGNCCIDGDHSLLLRNKSTVQCGDFGRVQDNCVLSGGSTQLFFVPNTFGDGMAENVKVKGLTFQNAEFVSVALANQGDITFDDCLWKDHHGQGTFFMAFEPAHDEYHRRLQGTEIDMEHPHMIAKHVQSREYLGNWYRSISSAVGDDHHRRLEEASHAHTMEVTILNSVFENCKQGPTGEAGIPLYGIISILTPFSPMTIYNTMFRGNIYDGSDGSQTGFAIESLGSPLTIKDSCFIDNDFIGFGPIHAYGGTTLDVSNNYISRDNLIICQFAAKSNSFSPQNTRDVTCVEADAVKCVLEG